MVLLPKPWPFHPLLEDTSSHGNRGCSLQQPHLLLGASSARPVRTNRVFFEQPRRACAEISTPRWRAAPRGIRHQITETRGHGVERSQISISEEQTRLQQVDKGCHAAGADAHVGQQGEQKTAANINPEKKSCSHSSVKRSRGHCSLRGRLAFDHLCCPHDPRTLFRTRG